MANDLAQRMRIAAALGGKGGSGDVTPITGTLRRTTGTATADSASGKVTVRLAEGDPITVPTTAAVKSGQTVSLLVSGGVATAVGVAGWGDSMQKQVDATKAEVETVKTTYATKSELSATDTELSGKVSDALTTAKSYTDSSITTEVTNRDAAIKAQADSITLEVSKNYTKSETFSAYQSTNDAAVAAVKSTADEAYSRTLRIELVSVPEDNSNDTSQLTAYVYRGGELLSDQDVAKLGIIAWYVDGTRQATGWTYTCNAGTAVECRLEA